MRISYSQYNMYLTCGIKYYRKYIEEIPLLSSPVLVGGKAVHKGIEVNYLQKVNTKVDLPVSDLKDCVADEIEKGFQEELFFNEDEKAVGKEKLRGRWKDLAVSGVEVYHKEVCPQVIPVGVEQEFKLKWGNHILHGFMDVVDEKAIIRDTKTTRKTPAENIAHQSQQLTLYAIAYKALYGSLPEQLALDYIVMNGKSKYVPRETTRTQADVQKFLMRLRRVIKGILADVFLPPSEAWACAYCQYAPECPEML